MVSKLVISHEDAVCIVSVGCSTAIGGNAKSTMAAMRAGISGFLEHPFMINQEGEPYVLAMSPFVDATVFGAERCIALAVPAVIEALIPLTQLKDKQQSVKVIIGLPELRPGVDDKLSLNLSAPIQQIKNDSYTIEDVRTAYKGHAAGLMALEAASKFLASGDCEFCLIGGVDSYIDPDTLDWIEDNEQLHIPSNAWGFIPGEAAAFCLVCTQKTALRYKLPIKATVVSSATAQEPNCIKTKTVCIGEGLTKAVSEAMEKAPEGIQINQTYCDQNGEAYRADEFGFMLARLSKYFVDPSHYVAPADCWGDVGAASGPLFLNSICSAVGEKSVTGTYSLLWASSEQGARNATLIAMGG